MGERGSDPDPAVLDLALRESRHVLDHQIQQLERIDDKIMRTVRTGVLLLGILLSSAAFAVDSASLTFAG
ncbi:MAG: hypothetical protein ABEJ42_04870 [Halobacteriaceae archaeon]